MLYLVKDDVGSQIKAVLTREDDGSAVDLSSATTVMRLRAKGTSTVLLTLTSSASTSDKADGIALFVFASGDLNLAEGKYEGEIEATFTTGNVETVYELVEIYIRADFD